MRPIAYVVAAVAAAGIMVAIIMMPAEDTVTTALAPAGQSPGAATEQRTSPSATADSVKPVGQLVLNVPTMHCPFACYPSVKETLEGESSVAGVELAQQEQEGVIDNPQVIVQFGDGFDVQRAIDLLAKKGFEDAEVVQ